MPRLYPQGFRNGDAVRVARGSQDGVTIEQIAAYCAPDDTAQVDATSRRGRRQQAL